MLHGAVGAQAAFTRQLPLHTCSRVGKLFAIAMLLPIYIDFTCQGFCPVHVNNLMLCCQLSSLAA